jgi:hypothetical protein
MGRSSATWASLTSRRCSAFLPLRSQNAAGTPPDPRRDHGHPRGWTGSSSAITRRATPGDGVGVPPGHVRLVRIRPADDRMWASGDVWRRFSTTHAELELAANALLFSLAGSPFLYYGETTGMGDNIWLPDRRLPAPRCSGLPTETPLLVCRPGKLYLPAVHHWSTTTPRRMRRHSSRNRDVS